MYVPFDWLFGNEDGIIENKNVEIIMHIKKKRFTCSNNEKKLQYDTQSHEHNYVITR